MINQEIRKLLWPDRYNKKKDSKGARMLRDEIFTDEPHLFRVNSEMFRARRLDLAMSLRRCAKLLSEQLTVSVDHREIHRNEKLEHFQVDYEMRSAIEDVLKLK